MTWTILFGKTLVFFVPSYYSHLAFVKFRLCNDDQLCFLGATGTYLDKTVLTAGTSHRQTNVGGKKATQNLMTKTERMNSSTGPGMITSFDFFVVVSLLLKLDFFAGISVE